MTVSEFANEREKIEKLINEIDLWINKKSITESTNRLEEAHASLSRLAKLADNDIQEKSVNRLTRELENMEKRAEGILSKRKLGKNVDGNIAIKCNWNDKKYRAPCSNTAYRHNVEKKRVWCSSEDCDCREFGKNVSIENYPCYESIALKEMFFGAGCDQTDGRNRPKHIRHVKTDRVAILTTRPPSSQEKDRLIICVLFIEKVVDDPGVETKIYGNKFTSIKIDYNKIKVKFWDYYKNPEAEDTILWGYHLHRYISNEAVLNILNELEKKYKKTGSNARKIRSLIRAYEKLQ